MGWRSAIPFKARTGRPGALGWGNVSLCHGGGAFGVWEGAEMRPEITIDRAQIVRKCAQIMRKSKVF